MGTWDVLVLSTGKPPCPSNSSFQKGGGLLFGRGGGGGGANSIFISAWISDFCGVKIHVLRALCLSARAAGCMVSFSQQVSKYGHSGNSLANPLSRPSTSYRRPGAPKSLDKVSKRSENVWRPFPIFFFYLWAWGFPENLVRLFLTLRVIFVLQGSF